MKDLYKVIRIGSTWAVVLQSKKDCVQFRGSKVFCTEWIQANTEDVE